MTNAEDAVACVAALEALTQRRPGADLATDVQVRAYVQRLAAYPRPVLARLPDRWIATEGGRWWPSMAELMDLADEMALERTTMVAGEHRRIGGGDGASVRPSGPTASYVADCLVRFGPDWVAAWLGQGDGGWTCAPWVRFTRTEVQTIEFGAIRLREKTGDLMAKHGVRAVATKEAQEAAEEWGRAYRDAKSANQAKRRK